MFLLELNNRHGKDTKKQANAPTPATAAEEGGGSVISKEGFTQGERLTDGQCGAEEY